MVLPLLMLQMYFRSFSLNCSCMSKAIVSLLFFRVFFDVSDGIFLNYTWDENNLTMTTRGVGQDRRYDVYVGVDVFGRGCFGGGGWNTNKVCVSNFNLITAPSRDEPGLQR